LVARGKTVLDLTGLKCPLPALKARKGLSELPIGAEFTVFCSDPMAAIDIPNMVRETGNSLIEKGMENHQLWFRIRKTCDEGKLNNL